MRYLLVLVLVLFIGVANAASVTTEELPVSDAVTGFDVSFDAGSTSIPGIVETGPGGGYRLQATPLSGNGTVQVRAVNSVGPGLWSDPLQYTTAVPGQPIIILVP